MKTKTEIKNWEQENNTVIKKIFDNFLIHSGENKFKDSELDYSVEFIITPACNQKCEYCYLVKHGDKLYPKEIRDENLILNNLNTVLQYFLENNISPINIDIFSGEIWSTTFGFSILKTLLDYVSKTPFPPHSICIPSNCSFILNDKAVQTLEKYFEAFEFYGTRLFFSISIDGPYLEEHNRSFNDSKKNNLKNDNFYDKLFQWGKKWDFGFHPMVNAFSIEKWPQQYDWWINKLKEYDLDYWSYIMFLEVRDDEWSDEKIKSYLKFLKHCLNTVSTNVFNNDYNKMLKMGLGFKTEEVKPYNYYHLSLRKSSYRQGCSVDRMIALRLGDLAWVPCHRTSYEKFIYGKLIVENNKVIDMQALNLPLLFSVYGLGYKGHPECDVCSINTYCQKGCYGAQFETHKEFFYPCSSVCNLHKAKALFLYNYYLKLANSINNKEVQQQLQLISNSILNIEKEFIDKWEPYITTLI